FTLGSETFKALDGKPQFLNGMQFPIDLSSSAGMLQFLQTIEPRIDRPLDGFDRTRLGAAADGVTRILLRFATDGPGTVSFRADKRLLADRLSRIDALSVPPVNVPTIDTGMYPTFFGGQHVAYALYVVPDGILPGEKQHVIEFTADFTPTGG